MKKEIKRECESCRKIVYYIKFPGIIKTYVNWQKGSVQSGMSKKYPKELAGWCEKHKPQ